MKKLKLFLCCCALLLLLIFIAKILVRRPRYVIQTSGKLYIVNKGSKDITVFDLFKGKQIKEIPIDVESHSATSALLQNKIIITNYGTTEVKGKSLTIINTNNNKIDKTIVLAKNNLGLDGIVAIPKSNKVGFVSAVSNTFFIVDLATGTIEKEIPTQQLVSHIFVFHPYKPFAYVTNILSASVSVINLNENKVVKIISCGKGTHGIAITPNGSEIWVTNTFENTISIINTLNNKVIKIIKAGVEPLNLKFSNDGKYCLVANSLAGTISVFNQKSKIETKTISIPGKKKFLERLLYHTPRPVFILMHPNGRYAFVSNSNANKVEVLDMKTFEIVSTIGTGLIPDAMTFAQ